MVFGDVWQCCTEFAGMCIRTTNAWSWPATLRRSWTAGRHLCYRLESTLRKSPLVLWTRMQPNLDRSCTCLHLTFTLYALTAFVTINPGHNPLSLSSCSPFSFPLPKRKSPPPLPSRSVVGSSAQHSWPMMSHQYVCMCVCSSLFLISSS